MKSFLLLVLIVFVNSISAQNQTSITLKEIQGLWYVNLSNFPMWLEGDKLNPRINYTIVDDEKLLDEVSFEKKGKTKKIVGYDRRDKKDNKSFVWKGKGIMALFKSKWSIIHFNAKYEIALISFEKTAFTPAGYDVISRNKRLSATALENIRTVIKKLGVNEELTEIKQN